MEYRTVNLFLIVCLILASATGQPGESAMTTDAFGQELVTALEARDVDGFMQLVSADITCLDGSDYGMLMDKMNQFFAQVPFLQVKGLGKSPLADGQVEVKTRLELNMQGREDPFPWVLYFVAEARPEGYRITDIYDENEYQKKNSPLYDPEFNRAGLPEDILDLMDRRCGVWVGDDVEIVRTRRMEIRFARDPESPTGLWARFSLLRYADSGLEQNVRALVYANSATRTHKVHARSLGSFAADEPYMADPDLASRVAPQLWHLQSRDGSAMILKSEQGEIERVFDSGYLERLDAHGNLLHRLERVEEVEALAERPPVPKPSAAPLGECLRAWQLGSDILMADGVLRKALIATRHHDYIFEVRKDFCYCRSSRYETCDKGMVGQTDVRLMVNPNEFTSHMPGDLPQRARQRIAFDEALFDPTICVITADTFYWSVKSITDDLIQLHGCQGDTYPYYRPQGVLDKIEWFRSSSSE